MTGEHCIYRIHDNFREIYDNVAGIFREIGCDRFAFGSEYPYGNPGSDIKRIIQLSLNDDEKPMILGKNTYKLYYRGAQE